MAEDHYQLIVIGGGAAGFFGAITAAEHGVERVLILEKSKEVLTKVRISGGGRCNVTHDCLEPRELVKNYPRGHRSLHGPFSRFNATDTIAWFEDKGVPLKTEGDGRMFPTTNTSETIVSCLTETARSLGVEWRTRHGVTSIEPSAEGYLIRTSDGSSFSAQKILVSTGGLRGGDSRLATQEVQHDFSSPIASLFTFKIDDPDLHQLSGLSVPNGTIQAHKQKTTGPVLITHWGLSGPATLKLSAWAARELADTNYHFPLTLNWNSSLSPEQVRACITSEKEAHPTRQIQKRSLFKDIPQRLWSYLCNRAQIPAELTYANLSKKQNISLITQLTACPFGVTGKSTNKDEFVTCGGVHLKDLDLKTMESKTHPGIHFAGEVLDIDGITGGFNFQAAWTTGHLAGVALASS